MKFRVMHWRALCAIGAVLSVGIYAAACSSDDTPDTPTIDAGNDVATTQETGTTCPAQPTPSCTAAKCTSDLGQPAVCVANVCKALRSDDCPYVSGATTSDNAIVMGALLARNGANALSGLARVNSIELAINEINASGGIPDPDACKPKRMLALVACDDSNAQPDGGALDIGDGGSARLRAAGHLIDDLKVPVIVGGSTSGNTVEIATGATIPGKTMLFSPSSTAVSITTLDASPEGTRLVWRAAPPDTVQSKVLQLALADITAQLKAEAGAGTLKVALVTKNDAYGQGIKQAFETGLTVNGQPITANADYTSIVYKNAPTDTLGVLQSDAVNQLKSFKPDIIVLVGTAEATTGVLQPYEASNPSTKPYYLVPDGPRKNELLTAAASITDLRTRLRGTVPGIVTPLAQDFYNFRYKTAYPDGGSLVYGMAGSYDITYLVAYAAAAAKGGTVDGTALAKNMAQLVGGTAGLDVGPAKISDGMQNMITDVKSDFNGASGPLDFDLTLGEAPSDYGVWCIGIDANTNMPIFNDASGQQYSAKDDKLSGTFSCN